MLTMMAKRSPLKIKARRFSLRLRLRRRAGTCTARMIRKGMPKEKQKEYAAGDLVFAKVKGYPPWPARINTLDPADAAKIPKGKYPIFFYGTYETYNVGVKDIYPYKDFKNELGKSRKSLGFNRGLWEIENDPNVDPANAGSESKADAKDTPAATKKGKRTAAKAKENESDDDDEDDEPLSTVQKACMPSAQKVAAIKKRVPRNNKNLRKSKEQSSSAAPSEDSRRSSLDHSSIKDMGSVADATPQRSDSPGSSTCGRVTRATALSPSTSSDGGTSATDEHRVKGLESSQDSKSSKEALLPARLESLSDMADAAGVSSVAVAGASDEEKAGLLPDKGSKKRRRGQAMPRLKKMSLSPKRRQAALSSNSEPDLSENSSLAVGSPSEDQGLLRGRAKPRKKPRVVNEGTVEPALSENTSVSACNPSEDGASRQGPAKQQKKQRVPSKANEEQASSENMSVPAVGPDEDESSRGGIAKRPRKKPMPGANAEELVVPSATGEESEAIDKGTASGKRRRTLPKRLREDEEHEGSSRGAKRPRTTVKKRKVKPASPLSAAHTESASSMDEELLEFKKAQPANANAHEEKEDTGKESPSPAGSTASRNLSPTDIQASPSLVSDPTLGAADVELAIGEAIESTVSNEKQVNGLAADNKGVVEERPPKKGKAQLLGDSRTKRSTEKNNKERNGQAKERQSKQPSVVPGSPPELPLSADELQHNDAKPTTASAASGGHGNETATKVVPTVLQQSHFTNKKVKSASADDRQHQKQEEKQAQLEKRLVVIDRTIKTSLAVANKDIPKCLAAMDELSAAALVPSVLGKYPDIVDTLKKCRKYKGDSSVQQKAENLCLKLKTIIASDKDLIELFKRRALKEIESKKKESSPVVKGAGLGTQDDETKGTVPTKKAVSAAVGAAPVIAVSSSSSPEVRDQAAVEQPVLPGLSLPASGQQQPPAVTQVPPQQILLTESRSPIDRPSGSSADAPPGTADVPPRTADARATKPVIVARVDPMKAVSSLTGHSSVAAPVASAATLHRASSLDVVRPSVQIEEPQWKNDRPSRPREVYAGESSGAHSLDLDTRIRSLITGTAELAAHFKLPETTKSRSSNSSSAAASSLSSRDDHRRKKPSSSKAFSAERDALKHGTKAKKPVDPDVPIDDDELHSLLGV